MQPPVLSLTGFDEMFQRDGTVRDHYRTYRDWLQAQAGAELERKRREAELLFHRVGITFNVYGEAQGTERLIPFDSVPRIIPAQEWARLEQGIRQRVQALNLFLHDIYHEQDIICAGRMPAEQVFGNAHYQPCMQDIDLPNQVYAHISGVDLLRYTADSLDASHHFDITEQHPGFKSLRESWARGLKRTFNRLPDFEW